MNENNLNTTTLTHVGEEAVSKTNGNPYFLVRFKHGPFGKPVSRVMWGQKEDDGSTKWSRISPEEARRLIGVNVDGYVEITSVEIKPETMLNPTTGEEIIIRSRTVARFADETLEQAVRRCGSTMKTKTEQAITIPAVTLNGKASAAAH